MTKMAPRRRAQRVGCVDSTPAGWGGFDEFERRRDAGGAGVGALGDAGTEPETATLDSIGFVVRRWIQCSAG